MLITPSMSLTAWNSSLDNYSHTQLAQNWLQVDQHDHSPGKGVQINGSTGIVAASITGTQIQGSTITDANLVAPNNLTRRVLLKSYNIITGQTWTVAGQNFLLTTAGLVANGASSTGSPPWWSPDSSTEFSVSTKTFYGSIRVTALTNTVAPNWTLSAGLAQLSSVAGASGAIIYNWNAVANSGTPSSTSTPASSVITLVSGAPSTVSTTSVGSAVYANNTTFAVPSGLPVTPYVALSGGTGTQATGSYVSLSAQLYGYYA